MDSDVRAEETETGAERAPTTRIPRVAGRRSFRPGQAPRREGGGAARMIAVGVVAALVAVGLLAGIQALLNWSPFGTRDVDRSGPAVLVAVRDLAEYKAVSGSYQIVIDLQQDTKLAPDILKNRRTLFLAVGSVDAYVDFGRIGDGAVDVSADRRTVTLTLPHARLGTPALDENASRVLDRSRGLLDRVGDLFGDGSDPQLQQVRTVAVAKLSDAARTNRLTDRAETNTRAALDKLLRSLGFSTVTIRFTDSPAR